MGEITVDEAREIFLNAYERLGNWKAVGGLFEIPLTTIRSIAVDRNPPKMISKKTQEKIEVHLERGLGETRVLTLSEIVRIVNNAKEKLKRLQKSFEDIQKSSEDIQERSQELKKEVEFFLTDIEKVRTLFRKINFQASINGLGRAAKVFIELKNIINHFK